jgi:pyruvate/2-oxoglutarate dehydrogenase complex dihydrolipoamide acyltransferase (E2) component
MSYRTIPYPKVRTLQEDVGAVLKSVNSFHALLEVDVTCARNAIKQHKQQTGEGISFTGFVAYCLGRAVEKHPQAHALRNWRGDFVLFDDADINVLIEAEAEGKKLPLIHVIRAANTKTLLEIHRDIRAAQSADIAVTTGMGKQLKWWSLFMLLPGFMRRTFWRIFFLNPHWIKQTTGTISLSAVGMAGKGGGYGIPNANLSLSVIVGGITERPVLQNGQLSNREFLNLTLAFNHDVIDGAPAARFINDLRVSIEQADGLSESSLQ